VSILIHPEKNFVQDFIFVRKILPKKFAEKMFFLHKNILQQKEEKKIEIKVLGKIF